MGDLFQDFLGTVPPNMQPVVLEINEFLTQKGCKCKIKEAKSGHVVSYTRQHTGKSLLNYVFRKSGVKIRIYASHVSEYEAFLDTLSDDLKKGIQKAGDCKKLNGQNCSLSCLGGCEFNMDGVVYKKCKNTAFMFDFNEKNTDFIYAFLKNEMEINE